MKAMTDVAVYPDMDELRALVRQVAAEELMPRFTRVDVQRKADGSIVTEADHAMQQRISTELSRRWPQFDLLGEESSESEQRRLMDEAGDGLWCLDPVDGTSNFAAGIPFFAVSLALLRDGQPVLGLIHDPVRGEDFTAIRGQGAFLNGKPLRPLPCPNSLDRCLAAVDFKRLDSRLATAIVGNSPYGSQRNFGSCALEWGWIAAGRIHVYLHGGQKLWDLAAGTLILDEAGGGSSTLQGEPVFRLGFEARSAVASADPGLHALWKQWLAAQSDLD